MRFTFRGEETRDSLKTQAPGLFARWKAACDGATTIRQENVPENRRDAIHGVRRQ